MKLINNIIRITLYLHRIAFVLSVTLLSCIPCCFINHEIENKRIHYSVNLTNKGNKTFLSFILSFFFFFFFFVVVDIRRLIKKLITTWNLTYYNNCLHKSLAENEKSFLYIKLRQAACLYFSFLFPSSVL